MTYRFFLRRGVFIFGTSRRRPLQRLCDFWLCGGFLSFSGRRGAVPYRMSAVFVCALIFQKSNIGEQAGSRWSLTACGSYCSVGAQTTPIFALNYGTGQSTSLYIQTSPWPKKFGGRGGLFKSPPQKKPCPRVLKNLFLISYETETVYSQLCYIIKRASFGSVDTR